ncbi:hypothetical protein [Gallaecimonas pentaromativorans]|uniref:hypothetical protein n=1 Tax=Gallaecimonas pentaromativorans TaxID=584787 RepID=UPI003A8F609B
MNRFSRHTPWTKVMAGLLFLDAIGGLIEAKSAFSDTIASDNFHGATLIVLPLLKVLLGYLVLQRQRRALSLSAILYGLQILGVKLGGAFIALSTYRAVGVMIIQDNSHIAIDLSALVLCAIATKAWRSAAALPAKTPAYPA